MKTLLIDMSGAQSQSRFRGVGRYTHSLVKNILQCNTQYKIYLLVNASLDSKFDIVNTYGDHKCGSCEILFYNAPKYKTMVDKQDDVAQEVAKIIREWYIASLSADIVFITSFFEGFVDNLGVSVKKYYSTTAKIVVVVYDLIPYFHAEFYLTDLLYRSFYLEKLKELAQSDYLIAISKSSKQEAVEVLSFNADKIAVVTCAAEKIFDSQEKSAVSRKSPIQRGVEFIFYAPGGFDFRKNLEKLFEAYSLLDAFLKEKYQLVIAGKLNNFDKVNLFALAEKYNIRERLVLTDYITDDELVALYEQCVLFVYPSVHEGFGLPVLEAMSCGAAVIGSNTTSIPEVIGLSDALFDPSSAKSIADLMATALQDIAFYKKLKENSSLQKAKFCWNKSAVQALQFFDEITSQSNREISFQERMQQFDELYMQLIDLLAKHLAARPLSYIREISSIVAENYSRLKSFVKKYNDLSLPLKWRVEGPFDSNYSLAILNREMSRALSKQGCQVSLHSTEGPGDFKPSKSFLQANEDISAMYQLAQKDYPVDVISRNLYPPRTSEMHGRVNLMHSYAWEESGFPVEWVNEFNLNLDGITYLSRHIAFCLESAGVYLPHTVAGIGVDHWLKVEVDQLFKLKAKKFKFLHVSSCFPRKGVDVLLKAYAATFTAQDDVSLIIKTFHNPHNTIKEQIKNLKSSCARLADIVLIEDDLNDSQLKSVYQQCDVLVGPSRAEGFGMPFAEAMLSGLPVITTGWGGQLDFCNNNTAWLLDYEYAYAKTHFGLFASAWAEPKVEHLAALMRELHQLPKDSVQIKINNARELLLKEFTWEKVTQKTIAAVRKFSAPSQEKLLRIGCITTWQQKCGIASYSEHLFSSFYSKDIIILAEKNSQADVSSNVIKAWAQGDASLDGVFDAIQAKKINCIVLQFNYGFFNFKELEKLIFALTENNIKVVVILHATQDPVHAPKKKLTYLVEAFKKCSRLLVHSVADLNRLKCVGLIDNVALFPHGIISWNPPVKKTVSCFTVATYGFLLPHKGLFETVQAIKVLRDKGINVQLKMYNAEYPADASVNEIFRIKEYINIHDLKNCIHLSTEFTSDEESLLNLSAVDLVVFPYQFTSESSSAAVRNGIVSHAPVAVTPLSIFDDVAGAVHYLPGTTASEIAAGILALMKEIQNNSEAIRDIAKAAQRLREQFKYPTVARQLNNMLRALTNNIDGSEK